MGVAVAYGCCGRKIAASLGVAENGRCHGLLCDVLISVSGRYSLGPPESSLTEGALESLKNVRQRPIERIMLVSRMKPRKWVFTVLWHHETKNVDSLGGGAE